MEFLQCTRLAELQGVLARIIEPTSKPDSLRVLEEAGMVPASYRAVTRRLPAYADERGGSGCRPPARRTPGWPAKPGALRRVHPAFPS